MKAVQNKKPFSVQDSLFKAGKMLDVKKNFKVH
jgi:hypothetical protein